MEVKDFETSATKAELKVDQDKKVKHQAFDSSHFCGKSFLRS